MRNSIGPSFLPLFMIYVLSAEAAVYLLRIRHKLEKDSRWTAYDGSATMTAGQITRLISVLTLLAVYVVYANYLG